MIALVFLFFGIYLASIRVYDWWHGHSELF